MPTPVEQSDGEWKITDEPPPDHPVDGHAAGGDEDDGPTL